MISIHQLLESVILIKEPSSTAIKMIIKVIEEEQSLNYYLKNKELIIFLQEGIILKLMVRMNVGLGLMESIGEDLRHFKSLLIGIMIRFIWD